jgi:hypothetical protein
LTSPKEYALAEVSSLESQLKQAQEERDKQHGLFVAADSILDEIGDHFNNEKRGLAPFTDADLKWVVNKTCDERPYAQIIEDYHLLEYYVMKRERESLESRLQAVTEALRLITNEVQGCSRLSTWTLRQAISNTNVAVMHDRVRIAQKALAPPTEPSKETK